MSGLKDHVRWQLDRLCADADLTYEELTSRWAPATPAPARAREAVAPYLPGEPKEAAFGRMLAAYARCERGCLDRAEGNPECWDSCRRAKAAAKDRDGDPGSDEGNARRRDHALPGVLHGNALPDRRGSLIEIVPENDAWHRAGDIIDNPSLGQAWSESDSWEVVP